MKELNPQRKLSPTSIDLCKYTFTNKAPFSKANLGVGEFP